LLIEVVDVDLCPYTFDLTLCLISARSIAYDALREIVFASYK
jgi:hypothetical protein